MAKLDYGKRQFTCKVVYYGPARSGKTTNLEVIHAKAPGDSKGDLVAISAEEDRSLRFDFLPLRLGKVHGLETVMQLYSVPGQVSYDSTRKHVLQGADGIVFVADSSPLMREDNVDSVENLIGNLRESGRDVKDVPVVFQWNKRDLPDAMPVEEMNADLNRWNAPSCESVAVSGEGVFQTMKIIAALVMPDAKR